MSTNDGRTRYEGTHDGGGETRYEGAEGVTGDGATRYEEGRSGSAGATHYEGGTGTDTARLKWVVVPDGVLANYDYLDDISSGGAQADVIRARDRHSGTEVAIKIYRSAAAGVDESALSHLRAASEEHVVPILAVGEGQGKVWEVQEYFAHGSLQRMFDEHPGGLAASRVREIVAELADAIAHIHGLGIIHRDLKPDNVLIRTLQPLDLVLGDFGVARQLVVTQKAGSVAGTFAYMAPEAQWGLTARPGDWWALGIILFEALTGRHLFAAPGGVRLIPDAEIRVAVGQGTYAVSGLPDDRWSLLVRGLLTRRADDRWGEAQVRDWLAGKSPEVASDPGGVLHEVPVPVAAFPFAGKPRATPAELAEGFRGASAEAAFLLADPRATARLRAWLGQHGLGEPADAVLKSDPAPDLALVLLQGVMAPDRAPVYQSVTLDARGLLDVAKRASAGDEWATQWIRTLRTEQILGEWAAVVPGIEAIGLADERLRSWWRAIDEMSAPARQAVSTNGDALEGLLLRAAFDEMNRQQITADNAKVLGDLSVLPEPFLQQVRPVASDTSDAALGVRTMFRLQLPVERTTERGRRDSERRQRWARIRTQAWRNGRRGGWLWLRASIPLVAVAIVMQVRGLWYAPGAVAIALAPWWMVFVLSGAAMWVFRQRVDRGMLALGAAVAGLGWGERLLADLAADPYQLPMSLWIGAIVAAGIVGLVGWLGGFMPDHRPRDRAFAGADRAFARSGVLLLLGLWLAILARLEAEQFGTVWQSVSHEVNRWWPEVRTPIISWLSPLTSLLPSGILPVGAMILFVLGGLGLILGKSLRLQPRLALLPRLITCLVLLPVVFGLVPLLWIPMVVLAAMALLLFLVGLGRWARVR